LIQRLNELGQSHILVVDHLGTSEKWRNLAGLCFSDYIHKDTFVCSLEAGAFGRRIEAVFHLGACSSTTETDVDYLVENNYRYTARLAAWCLERRSCRFVYASSAATYGDGAEGYSDHEERLPRLRPLNAYGFSKHLFDLKALRLGWLRRIAGLKYFNVYGPNEAHKGEMRSAVSKAFPDVRDRGVMRLFRSHREDIQDGEQRRDFIYVDDAVEMTLFFLGRADVNGIYNIGTGEARTWNDLARALFATMDRPASIEYIDMPEELRGRYQYRTQADMTRLREAGCAHRCRSLEEGVGEYVTRYLLPGK
jgi:ADP-L-glycero-D-manno-heptose 6-epimerase